jgi:uncharacterized protein YaeQ
VATTASIYNFDIELSDVDRQVYESLRLRVAQHPSETEPFLLARVLAYCLEYTEGISFGRGLAEPGEPAISVRDLTGSLRVWIDIGTPDADRLHKASKLSPRVVVYTHKDPGLLARQLAGARIHRAEALEVYGLDREFLATLATHLARRTVFTLTVTEREVYLTIDGVTLTSRVERVPIVTTIP